MFQSKPEISSSNSENFFGNRTLRIETPFFIGSSARVKIGFHTTAGYFPLKVWEKIWIWKVRKKVVSFESFIWKRTRQFGQPTGDFLAELSNVFPSQFKQMYKIVRNPKLTFFHTIWPPGILNAVLKVLIFFRRILKIFFFKILKEIEIDSLFQ